MKLQNMLLNASHNPFLKDGVSELTLKTKGLLLLWVLPTCVLPLSAYIKKMYGEELWEMMSESQNFIDPIVFLFFLGFIFAFFLNLPGCSQMHFMFVK